MPSVDLTSRLWPPQSIPPIRSTPACVTQSGGNRNVKSWTIFVFCAQGFGYVMVVVVVVHETENETMIRVARDNLLCWGFSISPQILPWQSQEIP